MTCVEQSRTEEMHAWTPQQLHCILHTLFCALYVPPVAQQAYLTTIFAMEAAIAQENVVLSIDAPADAGACEACTHAEQSAICETADVPVEEGEVPDEQDAPAAEADAAEEDDEEYVEGADAADAQETISFSIAPGIFVSGAKDGALARFHKDAVLKRALTHAFRTHKIAASAEYAAWNKAATAFRKLISNKEFSLRYDAIARARDRALLKARKEHSEQGPAKAIKSFQSAAAGLISLLDAHCTKLAQANLAESTEYEATRKCKLGLEEALAAQSIYKGAVVHAEGAPAAPGKRKRARKAEARADVVAEGADASTQSAEAEAPMDVVDLSKEPVVPSA